MSPVSVRVALCVSESLPSNMFHLKNTKAPRKQIQRLPHTHPQQRPSKPRLISTRPPRASLLRPHIFECLLAFCCIRGPHTTSRGLEALAALGGKPLQQSCSEGPQRPLGRRCDVRPRGRGPPSYCSRAEVRVPGPQGQGISSEGPGQGVLKASSTRNSIEAATQLQAETIPPRGRSLA